MSNKAIAETLTVGPKTYIVINGLGTKVVRGTHGTNCAGTCAFNVYIKDGVVWREEQQASMNNLATFQILVRGVVKRGCVITNTCMANNEYSILLKELAREAKAMGKNQLGAGNN